MLQFMILTRVGSTSDYVKTVVLGIPVECKALFYIFEIMGRPECWPSESTAHLGLVIAGKAAIYIGLAMGFCQPPRVPSDVEFHIEYKRVQLIAYHKVI
ncbi:unnamed protein product, partial [Allacma fusca]